MRASIILAALALAGCSLVTVEQEPFPPLRITAERPPPGPPRVVLTDSNIQIGEKVQFEFGKSEILPVSYSLLDEVAQVLRDNPQIERVRVEGHTDAVGGHAFNLELSRQRAQAVKAYLVKQDIAKKRLVAQGYGPDQPLASNDTDEGRERNRRVEFNILEQGQKKTLVHDE